MSSADGVWRSKPVLAVLARLVQYGVPLLVGTGLARVVVRLLAGHAAPLVTATFSIAAAIVTSLAVSRVTMRLAPLAVLLQMTMIFPDRAPSRLKVARRSTSATELRALLDSHDASAHEAAVTMLALVTALSRHDKHTRGHSERVRLFCDLLSKQLALPEADRGRLRWAALIHDIGKLQVSALVLNKPGALDDDEWTAIRAHPAAGSLLAQPLEQWLGPWFAGIIQHHERYDGTGYPLGLAGDQISLAGRTVAVVDAFETMTAARSYKAARSVAAARAELTRCAGTHFDPAIVRSFLAIALPRLLWSVGPLAFLVNAPFLKWVGDGGARLVDAAGATAHGAANAAGVTALVVASGSVPSTAAGATPLHSATTITRSATAAGSTSTTRETTALPSPLRRAAPPKTAPPLPKTGAKKTTAKRPAPATAAPAKKAAKKAAPLPPQPSKRKMPKATKEPKHGRPAKNGKPATKGAPTEKADDKHVHVPIERPVPRHP
jgi:response regulator RpfG family c-di-GMP phosphodiesterase